MIFGHLFRFSNDFRFCSFLLKVVLLRVALILVPKAVYHLKLTKTQPFLSLQPEPTPPCVSGVQKQPPGSPTSLHEKLREL